MSSNKRLTLNNKGAIFALRGEGHSLCKIRCKLDIKRGAGKKFRGRIGCASLRRTSTCSTNPCQAECRPWWMPKEATLNIKQFLIGFWVILGNKQTFLSTVRIIISKIVHLQNIVISKQCSPSDRYVNPDYRVFQVKLNITKRHISASRADKMVLRKVLESSINTIFCIKIS